MSAKMMLIRWKSTPHVRPLERTVELAVRRQAAELKLAESQAHGKGSLVLGSMTRNLSHHSANLSHHAAKLRAFAADLWLERNATKSWMPSGREITYPCA